MSPAMPPRRSKGCALAAALAVCALRALLRGSSVFVSAPAQQQSRGQCAPTTRQARVSSMDVNVLQEGDKVNARSPDDQEWYSGRLNGQNQDGSWTVAWDEPDSGPETIDLGVDSIRKVYFFADYKVGDDCRALSPDDQRWYPGTVAELLGDDKFRVKWDEPDEGPETIDLHFENMKKVRVKRDYNKGDKVVAVYPADKQWYEAEVSRLNDDGTFQVRWDDPDGGPEESTMSPKQIRRRPIPFADIKVGQKYPGVVTSVRDKGFAFVDINTEGTGFLHISRIAAQRIENIHDFLQEDQEVSVWVVSKSNDGSLQFEVSMIEVKEADTSKSRGPHALDAFRDISSNEWLDAQVTSVEPRMVLVRVATESGGSALGMLPKSQVGKTVREADKLRPGQNVRVRVIKVERRRMLLSMLEPGREGGLKEMRRILLDNGEISAFKDMDSSEWLAGRVQQVKPYGAMVGLNHPQTGARAIGMVHVSEMSNDGGFTQVYEEVDIDQHVMVRVIGVDVRKKRMSLSMTEAGSDSEMVIPRNRRDNSVEGFHGWDPSRWLEGEVYKVEQAAAWVSIKHPESGLVADGMVHVSKIAGSYTADARTELQVGQKVRVRILGIERAGKEGKPRVHLSMIDAAGDGAALDVQKSTRRIENDASPPASQRGHQGVTSPGPRARKARSATRESVTARRDSTPASFESIGSSRFLEGKVKTILDRRGVFVVVQHPESAETADGFVPVQAIRDGFIKDINEEVKVGQLVRVRIVDASPAKGRSMKLSMRSDDSMESSLQGTGNAAAFAGIDRLQWLDAEVYGIRDGSGTFVNVEHPSTGQTEQGFVPIREIRHGRITDMHDEVRIGQRVQVRIVNANPGGGRVMSLTMKSSDSNYASFRFADESTWFDGEVSDVQEGIGAFVIVKHQETGDVVSGLVPIGKMVGQVELGQQVRVRVASVDMDRERLELTMLEKDRVGAAARPESNPMAFRSIPSLQWLDGEVHDVRNGVGAFVTVTHPESGAIAEGLVHMWGISNDWIEEISDEVQVGQKVKVRVLYVDEKGLKLTMKPEGDMFEVANRGRGDVSAFADVGRQQFIDGEVVNIRPEIGALVRVQHPTNEEARAVGLVRLVSTTADEFGSLEVGQQVKVRVLQADDEDADMSLSMKEAYLGETEESGSVRAFENFDPAVWLEGQVVGIRRFSARVQVRHPDTQAMADGTLHVMNIKDGAMDDIHKEVSLYQTIMVRVISVDVESGRLALATKEEGGGFAIPDKEDLGAFSRVGSSQWLDGEVVNTRRLTAVVKVRHPDGGIMADGTVHINQLNDDSVSSVKGELKVGEQVQVRVLSVDLEKERMALSMKPEDSVEAAEN